MIRNICPICESDNFRRPRLPGHPYMECIGCGFWTQQNLKPKVYEAFHEKSGDTMSDSEKELNFQIAGSLYLNVLFQKVYAGQNVTALDIGAKFPWLMHCLNQVSLSKISTWAIDGVPEIVKFCHEKSLSVNGAMCDFEKTIENGEAFPWGDEKFDLIVMIHMIEHLYKPLNSLRKVHELLKENGTFFIRCPASDVEGIERDFTPGHYDIHPQIWNKKSLEIMAAMVGFEIKMNNELRPGQRDLLLVKR